MELLEIRWHGRGGQGVVTAAKFLAEIALEQGKYFQAFPEYGPERMGAPIQAFTRISSSPIKLHCSIERPDIVLVLDSTLLSTVNVAEGLKNNGLIIVNAEQSPQEVKRSLKGIGEKKIKIFTLNATKIALETLGKPIPNIPVIGALAKATGIIDLGKVIEHIRDSFGKKFSSEIVEGNVKAVKRAFEEVKSD